MAQAEIARRIREEAAACEGAVRDAERGIGSVGPVPETLDALFDTRMIAARLDEMTAEMGARASRLTATAVPAAGA